MEKRQYCVVPTLFLDKKCAGCGHAEDCGVKEKSEQAAGKAQLERRRPERRKKKG